MKSVRRGSLFVKWAILLALPIAISTQLTGCEKESSGPGGYVLPARYFKDSVQPVFENSCIGCHQMGSYGYEETGADSVGGFDVNHAYASLVNHVSFERRFNATIPRLRVKPGSLDSSYLYRKLTSDTPGYGERMPLHGSMTDEDIAIITKWIQYDAPLGDTTTH